MLRGRGCVFSPTRHAAFKRRQFADQQNKENLARPKPVLRPQRALAVVWLLPASPIVFSPLSFLTRASFIIVNYILGKCNISKRIKRAAQIAKNNPSIIFLFKLTDLILGRDIMVNRMRTKYQMKSGIPMISSANPL